MWKNIRLRFVVCAAWLTLALLSIYLPNLLGPDWIEHRYSEGLFISVIRHAQDLLSRLSPVPLVYVLLLLVVFSAVRFFVKLFRKEDLPGSRFLRAALGIVSFLAASVFFFQVLWGWNYARIPVAQKLGLDMSPYPREELEAQFLLATDSLVALRHRLQGKDSLALDATWVPDDLAMRLRKQVKATLEHAGYPSQGQVRIRGLRPQGVLLRFGTAGIYLPWVGEGHYDSGLHPIQIPFVMAHEMAHGYGFGDEGVCNFWAYLACLRSKNEFVRYSGALGFWRYLASEYRRYAPDAYKEVYQNRLSSAIRADLRAIYENGERFPDLMPKLRDVAYDSYLKAQGVEEGLQSYNQVVMMVRAWNLLQSETTK